MTSELKPCFEGNSAYMQLPVTAEEWALALAAASNAAAKRGMSADSQTYLEAVKAIQRQATTRPTPTVSLEELAFVVKDEAYTDVSWKNVFNERFGIDNPTSVAEAILTHLKQKGVQFDVTD